MENYLRFVCILLLCNGCQEDYGGAYLSYCNDSRTSGILHVIDAETEKPLSGITFYAVENAVSIFSSEPLITTVDTFISDFNGIVKWKFEHSVGAVFTYYLVPALDDDYVSADQYNLPIGCETTFDAPMKKKTPATLTLVNSSDTPLLNYSLSADVMPRFYETGVLGRDTVSLGQFEIDSIPANATTTLNIKSIPNELLRFTSSFDNGLVRLVKENTIVTTTDNYLNFTITL